MSIASSIERYFLIHERGSTIGREIQAGLLSFLTIGYILAVNPSILSLAGLPSAQVTSSTALASSIATLLCGLFANLPFAIAPGMGLNAYLTFSLVLGIGMPVEQALACCMVAALLVGTLAVLRALSLILNLVPDAVKLATVVGMGLLLSLIGLKTAGVVVGNKDTLVEMGDLMTLNVTLTVLGLSLIAALIHHNVRGSILIGMSAVALLSFTIRGDWPTSVFSPPSFILYQLDFTHVISMSSTALSAVLAYSLVMIFDIGGATFGLGKLAGLAGAQGVPGSTLVFLSACIGTAIGSVTGTTPLIIAAESAVGIKEGGKTGLTAVVTSACFALSLFFAPLIQSLPEVTTTPVLVLVGAMMIGEAGHIDWTQMKTAIPAFLTIVIQPFTFSIANGIYAGLLFSFLLFFLTGDFIIALRGLFSSRSQGSSPHPHPHPHPASGSDELNEPLLDSPVFDRSSLARATSRIMDYVEDLSTSQPFDLTPELLIGEARPDHMVKSPTMRRGRGVAAAAPASGQGLGEGSGGSSLYPPVPDVAGSSLCERAQVIHWQIADVKSPQLCEPLLKEREVLDEREGGGNIEGPYRNFIDDIFPYTNTTYCEILQGAGSGNYSSTTSYQGGLYSLPNYLPNNSLAVNANAYPPSYQKASQPSWCPTLSFQVADGIKGGPVVVPYSGPFNVSALNDTRNTYDPSMTYGFCQTSQPSWSAYRDPSFGFATLTFESIDVITLSWFRNVDPAGKAADTTTILRKNSCNRTILGQGNNVFNLTVSASFYFNSSVTCYAFSSTPGNQTLLQVPLQRALADTWNKYISGPMGYTNIGAGDAATQSLNFSCASSPNAVTMVALLSLPIQITSQAMADAALASLPPTSWAQYILILPYIKDAGIVGMAWRPRQPAPPPPPLVKLVYKASLAAVTGVTTMATGLASVTLVNVTYGNGYFYATNINQMTMAHLHFGAVGVNGPPIVWAFNITYGPVSGSIKALFNFNPSLNNVSSLLAAGLMYFNVHTTAYPAGEIRGQLYPPV